MLASIKEGLKLYYLEQEVNGTNEDPVTNKIPQDELTDEPTISKVVAYQNGVDFISDIKYDNLYYLDFNKINVSDVDEEQKYFMDIETNTVFINEGLKIIGTDYIIYVLDEYEGTSNDNILRENNKIDDDRKIYVSRNNSYVLKTDGTVYGVGETNSYNPLMLGWRNEYDINNIPQKTNIKIIDESEAQDEDFTDIVAGNSLYILRKKNGEVWGIGTNNYGQLGLGDTTPRYELTKLNIEDVKQIQMIGDDAIIFLKKDGTVWATGRNIQYQFETTWSFLTGDQKKEYYTSPIQISYKVNGVEQYTNIKLIADATGYGTIFIKENGEIWANYGYDLWGRYGKNATGKVLTPFRMTELENIVKQENSNVKKIFSSAFVQVLLENGKLYTSGYGSDANLGNGNTIDQAYFEKVLDNINDITTTSTGLTAALNNENELYAWGRNAIVADEKTATPTFVKSDIISINGMILDSNGLIFKLGKDNEGLLYTQYNINTNKKIKKVSNNVAIDEDYYLWTFGSILTQDKGRKILLTKSTETEVNELLFSQNAQTILNKKSDSLYFIGDNTYNTFSKNTKLNITQSMILNTPEGISLSDIRSIKWSLQDIFIIDNSNNLYYSGYGYYGFGNNIAQQSLIGKYQKDTNIEAKQIYLLANAYNTVLVLDTQGKAWVTGYNDYGQLGLGDLESRRDYNQLQYDNNGNTIDFSKLKKITDTRERNITALMEDGTIYTWGKNINGQLGLGSNENILKPTKLNFFEDKGKVIDVQALQNNTIYLLENGDVYMTGQNSYGQLGNGTREDSNVPVKVDISDVKEIYAGLNHVVAIKNDNTVWAWGSGQYGQLGTGKVQDELTPAPAYQLAN